MPLDIRQSPSLNEWESTLKNYASFTRSRMHANFILLLYKKVFKAGFFNTSFIVVVIFDLIQLVT